MWGNDTGQCRYVSKFQHSVQSGWRLRPNLLSANHVARSGEHCSGSAKKRHTAHFDASYLYPAKKLAIRPRQCPRGVITPGSVFDGSLFSLLMDYLSNNLSHFWCLRLIWALEIVHKGYHSPRIQAFYDEKRRPGAFCCQQYMKDPFLAWIIWLLLQGRHRWPGKSDIFWYVINRSIEQINSWLLK